MLELGIVGCHRYETDDAPGNQWKVCSKGEYENLLSLGFHVLADFEVNSTSWRGGYAQGLKHGEMGRRKWRAKGLPDERPVSFAVDSNVAPTQADQELALEYLRGCRDGSGVGPQMAYGESSVIDEAVRRGYTKNSHRAAAESWSDFKPSATASLRQVVQASYAQWFPPDAQGRHPYDENIIEKDDWGQHPAPTGGPVASIDEVNLRLIQIQQEVVGDVGSCKREKDQVAEALTVAKQALAAAQANQATLNQVLSIVQGLSIPAPAPVDVAALVRAINVDHGQRLING
jgi:hypothetical protein